MFISLMRSVNGAHILNATSHFSGSAGGSTCTIYIVLLASRYVSLESHKFDLNIEVLNLI